MVDHRCFGEDILVMKQSDFVVFRWRLQSYLDIHPQKYPPCLFLIIFLKVRRRCSNRIETSRRLTRSGFAGKALGSRGNGKRKSPPQSISSGI